MRKFMILVALLIMQPTWDEPLIARLKFQIQCNRCGLLHTHTAIPKTANFWAENYFLTCPCCYKGFIETAKYADLIIRNGEEIYRWKSKS